ncbi:hypothetical protein LXM94_15185 [Rhizobium sp. TRM95111]|uniref:hypothetical protein n=1 Tax=Rhizobium alarense TaxID=2846851 RepID=UPI001F261E6F|nr:hypothetical protein [Rhizobium alarense]MCF3641317.1 hypothetical protein [Rhizobium alarense]
MIAALHGTTGPDRLAAVLLPALATLCLVLAAAPPHLLCDVLCLHGEAVMAGIEDICARRLAP